MVTFFLNHWGGDLEQAKEDMKTLTDFRPECQFGSTHWQEFDSFLNFERIIGGEQYDKIYIVGRFMQADDLADDSGLAELLTSVNHVPVEIFRCHCILLGGTYFRMRHYFRIIA